MVQTQVTSKPKFRKFTQAERKRVYPRIIALSKAGLSTSEIAEKLDNEGFTAPGGISFTVKKTVISSVLTRMAYGELKKYEKIAATPKTQGKIGARLPDTLLGILTDPTLSDSQKIRMIAAYAEIEQE